MPDYIDSCLDEFDRLIDNITQVEDISFDCFELVKLSKGYELSYLVIYLLK